MTARKKNAFIPEFKGKRTLKIMLRTVHLLAISGVCGGIFFGVNSTLLWDFWIAAIVSGSSMMLIDSLSNLIWFIQVRGLVIMTKLGLIIILPYAPNWGIHIIVVVMVMSGIISHAPSQWRYYSFVHRKVVRSRQDSKG